MLQRRLANDDVLSLSEHAGTSEFAYYRWRKLLGIGQPANTVRGMSPTSVAAFHPLFLQDKTNLLLLEEGSMHAMYSPVFSGGLPTKKFNHFAFLKLEGGCGGNHGFGHQPI